MLAYMCDITAVLKLAFVIWMALACKAGCANCFQIVIVMSGNTSFAFGSGYNPSHSSKQRYWPVVYYLSVLHIVKTSKSNIEFLNFEHDFPTIIKRHP